MAMFIKENKREGCKIVIKSGEKDEAKEHSSTAGHYVKNIDLPSSKKDLLGKIKEDESSQEIVNTMSKLEGKTVN